MQHAIEKARLEGMERGKAEGKIVGRIETLAGLLGEEVPPLDNLSVDELMSIANDLQHQLRDRGVYRQEEVIIVQSRSMM